MGFKKTTRNLDFADLAMATCLEQNRSIKLSTGMQKCTRNGNEKCTTLPGIPW